MSSRTSGTPSLIASLATSKPSESILPAAPFSLPVGSTAIVYCEGQFGEQDGKTANGLVRHSEKYEILSVIDSLRAGVDAGKFLDGTANGIPVLASLAGVLRRGTSSGIEVWGVVAVAAWLGDVCVAANKASRRCADCSNSASMEISNEASRLAVAADCSS